MVAGLTAVNLRGVVESARLLIGPTLVFIAGVIAMILFDMLRIHPSHVTGGAPLIKLTDTVGIWLLLRAFSAGCSALTGVEAIANAVPQFREPRVRRAQRTEALLGLLLGLMLLGIAHVIGRFHLQRRHGVTILDQLSASAYGRGLIYYAFGIVTTIVLTLAANTSFGGLPVLLSLLARDNLLPHAFGLRGERPVFRYGVGLLGVAAAALLIAVNGDTQRLVPLFAIGVFIGFTLSQVGLARRAVRLRSACGSPCSFPRSSRGAGAIRCCRTSGAGCSQRRCAAVQTSSSRHFPSACSADMRWMLDTAISYH